MRQTLLGFSTAAHKNSAHSENIFAAKFSPCIFLPGSRHIVCFSLSLRQNNFMLFCSVIFKGLFFISVLQSCQHPLKDINKREQKRRNEKICQIRDIPFKMSYKVLLAYLGPFREREAIGQGLLCFILSLLCRICNSKAKC
jgi:hypothetical protein